MESMDNIQALEILEQLKWNISLVDGLLVETGGRFKENGFDNYICSCMKMVNNYYQNTKDKRELLELINAYINQYKDEISWKYYDYEMKFLNTIKSNIEHL